MLMEIPYLGFLFRCYSGPGVAEADPALLRLVFGNLVSNAMKFTGGRTNAKIEIGRTGDSTSETVFFVRDNGAGFDPEYSEKLFGSALAQSGGVRRDRAWACQHATNHSSSRGRVWAEGAVDVGATFYFSLPKGNRALLLLLSATPETGRAESSSPIWRDDRAAPLQCAKYRGKNNAK
jgi:light-regulated signal transduction histidine kinase (bacteriophytochrome)